MLRRARDLLILPAKFAANGTVAGRLTASLWHRPTTEKESAAKDMRMIFCRGALRKILPFAVLAGAIVAGGYGWRTAVAQGSGYRIVSGTGYIEGTEIAVAPRLTGRVEKILVKEGQIVGGGQVLVRMQVQSLLAERDEAYARYRHAQYAAAAAETEIVLRNSEATAAQTAMRQRDGEFESVMQSLTTALHARRDPSREQDLEELRAGARRAADAASAADAQWATTQVAIHVARMQLTSARSAIAAAEAAVRRVETELADVELRAPRDAVVLSRLANAGEVLTAGRPVLRLIDLSGVSVTLLVPKAACDRVAVGSEARVVLDSAPHSVIPATISFIGSVERTRRSMDSGSPAHDPMCRVRAPINRELVQRHVDQIKAGASAVGWVKVDPHVRWPTALTVSW